MPELPEVETLRRALERELIGRRLQSLDIYEPRLLQNASEEELQRALVGQTLQSVGRRAKFLLFDFGPHTAVLHLRMTGWPTLTPVQTPRFVFRFDQKKTLYFSDPRRLATLHLVPTAHAHTLPPLNGLGIEPFQPTYTLKNFLALLQTDQEIKRLLLDQRKIAGIGNIYACEALFASRIHPQRPAKSLSRAEARRLFAQIEKILARAIAEQGTTVKTYRRLAGESGNFQNFLAVYDRAGEPCVRCQTPIERLTQGGRGTYFCPTCQHRV
ncbi:MAG: bifunctional DNA-formamidopyrimidine glycosylase/DNA-(apurinic or apyrimidinic site) lyase [Candidatus Bipolaricaulota bacterium]|nr:bifunctional DNA-formamidopyrimidine glycosylase/DNA-(apurinic or apyrimidinic site) lyase [Candidatus Bipolaricaulota bacterium]MCS7275196.1 bifunctional DNA-formamidopyrimidine glycosylase/DNA-(apurinic or apyrimidinic site) lyase [Candidatus Bipolaricaulota bacterium]MDW8111409.1 bifunctional DNA-formamidopyrimidine glycosylase/DNA-(apurinic or apyrimidinic site) lyase [Candidatus Bipolaricaulota bacterium]MDW8329664.1 bifunctional DNA-formamidopyrimidine glycosylase/DNA-(apurinic or apyri